MDIQIVVQSYNSRGKKIMWLEKGERKFSGVMDTLYILFWVLDLCV